MHDLPEWPKSPNDGQKANAPLEVPRPTHDHPEYVTCASQDGSHLQGEQKRGKGTREQAREETREQVIAETH